MKREWNSYDDDNHCLSENNLWQRQILTTHVKRNLKKYHFCQKSFLGRRNDNKNLAIKECFIFNLDGEKDRVSVTKNSWRWKVFRNSYRSKHNNDDTLGTAMKRIPSASIELLWAVYSILVPSSNDKQVLNIHHSAIVKSPTQLLSHTKVFLHIFETIFDSLHWIKRCKEKWRDQSGGDRPTWFFFLHDIKVESFVDCEPGKKDRN